MKVECEIDPNCKEPFAVIHIHKMTPAVSEAISILEKEGAAGPFLFAVRDGKTYFVEPGRLEIIRTEGRELVCYDRLKNRHLLNKPLYELENMLGREFVRVSKSALINIRRIDHVEASFNGTMKLVMKNGIEDSVSRSCRKTFKERLGLE